MLHWGIIGTGVVAFELAYAIQSVKGNEIVAVSSRSKAKAHFFATHLKIANVYDSYNDLIKNQDIDIVYIALPNSFHAEIIKLCLENGKHVLCEKPFTINAEEAKEIRALSKEKKLFCMEAYWTRFIPSVQKLLSLIKEDHIGKIKMICGSFGNISHQQRNFDLAAGGGVLLDLCIYPIALTHAILGKPDEVTGSLTLGPSGVDVQASVGLKYKNGALASLTSSYLANLNNEFIVYGEKGSIKVCAPFYRSSTLEITYFATPGAPEPNTGLSARRNYFNLPSALKFTPFLVEQIRRILPAKSKRMIIPFKGNGYQYQIIEVNDCLDANKTESDLHSLNTTIEVMEILDAVRKQADFKYPKEELVQIRE
jgi:dihydrodiol dehydrogenase / D-xylose 1-dehydrogenase (NADP)